MQITSRVIMIRPVKFQFNTQTAESNAFQQADNQVNAETTQQLALQEFDNLVEKLQAEGIEVLVIEDTPEPHTPDSIFPNNWFSTHAAGYLFLYPMQAPNRRLERRQDLIDLLAEKYALANVQDLTHYEQQNRFLEGTGSMILDRENAVVYASLSPRTDKELVKEFAQQINYEAITFHAVDAKGKDIYHTNVLMCLGEKFAVICLDCVADEIEKQSLLDKFAQTDKEVITISFAQMENFAGNMLCLKAHNLEEKNIVVMSSRAYKSLNDSQIQKLEQYAKIVHSDISNIENNGGGSVRCMIAENFLALKTV